MNFEQRNATNFVLRRLEDLGVWGRSRVYDVVKGFDVASGAQGFGGLLPLVFRVLHRPTKHGPCIRPPVVKKRDDPSTEVLTPFAPL